MSDQSVKWVKITVLAILVSLLFHKNFRISLSISTKNHAGILIFLYFDI